MKLLFAAVLILPIVAAEGTTKHRTFNKLQHPAPYNANRTVLLGLKLMKDLVTLSQAPTLDNMAVVTPQLGVMGVMTGLANAAEIIGGILGIIFPDNTMREIKRMFRMLMHEIVNVRADIRRLEAQIEWANKQLQYAHVVNVITTATDLANKITLATSEAEKERRQDRFEEHCHSQGLQMSINVLFNGLTGKGLFQSNILASYYRVSRGHGPNMVKLGGRLLNLATGGLLSLMTYESIVRGRGGSEDIAKDYQPRMLEVRQATEQNINRCITNFKANMAADLGAYMQRHVGNPNSRISSALNAQMEGKYPWLAFSTAVYNKRGSGRSHRHRHDPNHAMARIQFPPTAPKNAWLFFVDKGAPFVGRNKVTAARSILGYDNRSQRKTFNRISGRLAGAGIRTWALVVVENRKDAFSITGNSGGRVVYVGGGRNQKVTMLA